MGYYATFNMTSVNYGIAFNYTYRDLAKLRLSYEGAPQDIDKGYGCRIEIRVAAVKTGIKSET